MFHSRTYIPTVDSCTILYFYHIWFIVNNCFVSKRCHQCFIKLKVLLTVFYVDICRCVHDAWNIYNVISQCGNSFSHKCNRKFWSAPIMPATKWWLNIWILYLWMNPSKTTCISIVFSEFNCCAIIIFESTSYYIKIYLNPWLDGNGDAPVWSECILAVP